MTKRSQMILYIMMSISKKNMKHERLKVPRIDVILYVVQMDLQRNPVYHYHEMIKLEIYPDINCYGS